MKENGEATTYYLLKTNKGTKIVAGDHLQITELKK